MGVEIAFLPCQVAFDDRPHLPHIQGVGMVGEMPKQLIDIVEVHIVVAHLVGLAGEFADIAIAIHLCSPFLCCPC